MNDLFTNFAITLSSPMILCFALGILAAVIRSDLKIPGEIYTTLTLYLLLAIGIKGGVKLSDSSLDEFWKPGLAAITLGISIPVWCYFILKKIGKFGAADSAALAAHYGSVSAVTFGEGLAFLDTLKVSHEGFLPALLAIMEIPAILVAIFIGKIALQKKSAQEKTSWRPLLHDLFTGKSTLLLLGGLAIGWISGHKGFDQVSPFFDAPFRGILAFFLLEIGLVTGRRISELAKAGPFLVLFGILMPVVHGILGIFIGHFVGLGVGGMTIFGLLAASASYIAAPAAVRIALPQASPAYYLTASLAITFPFNVTLGLPLYFTIAHYVVKTF